MSGSRAPRLGWYVRRVDALSVEIVEVGRRSQSVEGGPFLWPRHARTRELETDSPELSWAAEHDGSASLSPPASHPGLVRCGPKARSIEITDLIDTAQEKGLAFELELDEMGAVLSWPSEPGSSAVLELRRELRWSLHMGATDLILGWYSPGLGHRVPAFILLGQECRNPGMPLITRLTSTDTARFLVSTVSTKAVSWCASGARFDVAPRIPAEDGR